MFTSKFLGLTSDDAQTPYYYGSLPEQPAPGQVLLFHETGNRYAIVRVEGRPLSGEDAQEDQRELAWADIGGGKAVPTLWLQKLESKEITAQGRSFDYEEVKKFSQENRARRLSAS